MGSFRLFLVVLLVVACAPVPRTALLVTPSPVWTALPPPAPTSTASAMPTGAEPTRVEEAIQILVPGPGSRLVGPLHVSGWADSTFEQNLGVRVLLDDGSQIALTATTIQAELGNRGPFEVELPVTITGERQAFIQVYATSPRDGGITHLAAVGVLLADSGATSINPRAPQPEQIVIDQPGLDTRLSGGVVHVEGYAWASFEQTLIVDVVDSGGEVIGSQVALVDSQEMGQPGPFRVDVAYTLTVSGAGRVVVRDPSPAFNGDVHIASVEVTLEP